MERAARRPGQTNCPGLRTFAGDNLLNIQFVQTGAALLPADYNSNCTMLLNMFKSKIHRVKVTQAELNYVGSITIDADLLEAAHILEGEKVQIVNIENGERLETYTIKGERSSGTVCMNGPAARRVQVGDTIIVISYAQMTPEEAQEYEPVIIFPDDDNRIPR